MYTFTGHLNSLTPRHRSPTTTLSTQPSPRRLSSMCTFLIQFSPHRRPLSCRPSSLDVQFVDFDGVRFHLSTPDRKTALVLSMNIRCWDELVRYGVHDILQREYGPLLKATPENDYNVSLEIDLEQLPPEGGEYLSSSPRLQRRIYPTIHRTARRVSQKPRVVEAQCPCCTIRTWLPGPEAVGGGRQWSG